MRSTTEHIPLNSGTGRYIYRVTIDIDSICLIPHMETLREKKIFERIVKKKKRIGPPKNFE